MTARIQAAVTERMNEARTVNKGTAIGIDRLRMLEAQGHTFPRDSAVQRHCWVIKDLKEAWEVLGLLISLSSGTLTKDSTLRESKGYAS